MAVRTYADDYSTQWAATLAGAAPASPVRQPDDQGRVFVFSFDHTQGGTAGDATSTQGLFVLPPGRWKAIGMFVNTSAFGSSRTLDIGYQAHTDHAGATVNADTDAFAAAKDVSAALVGWGFNAATGRRVIDSRVPVNIIATVAGGTIPAAATVKGDMLFVRAG